MLRSRFAAATTILATMLISGPDDETKPTDNRKPGEIVVNASAMGLQSASARLMRPSSPLAPPTGSGAASSAAPSHEPPVD